MACNIRLYPLNVVGTPNGRWFLTEAPVGFDGDLEVGCIEAGPYSTESGYPDEEKVIGEDTGCTDLYDVWIRPPNAVGEYVFTFVSPDTDLPAACGEGPCGSCSEYTLTVVAAAEEPAPVSYCQTEDTEENLFTLAGVSCDDYDIDYGPGDQDAGFDITSSCVSGNLGDFNPSEIEVGTYTFVFTYIGSLEDCDDCTIELTVTIEEGISAGSDQEFMYCSEVGPC
jgi:hypothetical protein